MSDALDEAAARETGERDAVIARHLARPRPPGLAVCGCCGDEIPPERRQVQPEARLCIDCAERADRHSATRAPYRNPIARNPWRR